MTRGDELKIDSWPQALVTAVAIITGAGALAFLYAKGADLPTIGAFAVVVAGLFTGQALAARKASVVEAKTDQQTEQLHTIIGQTNGKSDEELDEIADRAALRVIAAYRKGELQ